MDEQEYDLTVPVNSEGLQNTKKSNGNKQRDCYKLLSNNE